ncbi:lipoyl synthase [Rothia sp. AR01]|uniref:Lipoyl synthase n=1 Tax=Rothia santali TaxID=2949643 RepID=A0A9X2H9M0_9MICC|nr:lipoyl synthase [Rothia santali]MCP3425549.1 lipoyl synthase [Rothia santali]
MTIAPEGRRLLRVEARNAEVPIEKKPSWMKNTARMGPEYQELKTMARSQGLHTVCEEAGCPNIYECWEDREATFLIAGDTCTRRCDFCDIATGRPVALDPLEPIKVARSIQQMNLRYATVTGVARDDLADGSADHYAQTIRAIHEQNPNTGVEILIPDFQGKPDRLDMIVDAGPEVYAHNVETVPRIFKKIRPAFTYERSLDTIAHGKDRGMITKSNLILGMGETNEEVYEALCDLHDAGTDIITLTQYLRPSPLFHPIDRWVKPEEFVALSQAAEEIGFLGVMAGPMVRSSYRAGRLWARAMEKMGRPIPEHLSHIEDSGSARQEASSLLAATS